MPKQEVTLDFDTFASLVKSVNIDLQQYGKYDALYSNLKKFHVLCLDKRNDNSSKWYEKYKSLLNELDGFNSLGPSLKKAIEDGFMKLIESRQLLRIESNQTDISSICMDIARKSHFKIIIKESKDKSIDLTQLSLDEFINGIKPETNCELLREKKIISFEEGDDTNFLKFLHPYLYYSQNIEIYDKFFLKIKDHLQIIQKLLSYMKEPESLIIHTNFTDPNDKNVQFIQNEINKSYKEKFCKLIYYKHAHPRRIITDYANIELTHTLDCLTISKNKLKAEKAIAFTITMKDDS
jgi:hypothetical protein